MEQGSCKLLGRPQYYDTYWYSYSPITTRWIPPELMANSSGFYNNLLSVKRYWDAELATEGSAPVPLGGSWPTGTPHLGAGEGISSWKGPAA